MNASAKLSFSSLQAGQVIGPAHRQFRLIKPVSNSPIGQVWHAYDLTTAAREADQDKVALEIISPLLADDDATLEAFKKYATLAKQLSHKHIAPTYGYFVSKEGWLFAAMEPLNTRSLARILREDGPMQLSVEKSRVILTQVGSALDYAQRQHNLSHGDLTPWNIIISPGTGAKLVNFAFRQPLLRRIHQLGQPVLNAEYLAPESFQFVPMTAAADVYAFGCLAYQLFTGRPPFGADETDEQRETKQLTPPALLTEEQWDVLAPCLSANPGDRPASTLAVIDGMFPKARDRFLPPPPRPQAAEEPRQRSFKRLLGATLLPAAAAFCLGAAAGYYAMGSKGADQEQELRALLLQIQDLLAAAPSEENLGRFEQLADSLGSLAPPAQVKAQTASNLQSYRTRLAQQEAEVASVLHSEDHGAFPPGFLFRDEIEPDVFGPSMVVVPAGTFRMGDQSGRGKADEKPVHEVTIKRAFALSQHEITFAQYDLFALMAGKTLPDDEGWGRGNRPVINISWNDANAYVHWLSRKTGLPYRLPSEAEWEYAARAGANSAYWWGNEAGFNRAACGNCGTPFDGQSTAPVGSFAPNPFQLHDLSGNVYEWVSDCYNPDYHDAPKDGSSWDVGQCNYRVMRGGSWYDIPDLMRTSSRERHPPNAKRNSWGFRVALDLSPEGKAR